VNSPVPPDPSPGPGIARRTPYELVFYPDDYEARIFPGIRGEAKRRGVDSLDADRFNFLSLAGDAVRDVVSPEAPPEALEQYRVLLYHAFNFWRFAKRVYVVDPAVARYLVEAAPSLEGWELTLPHPAVYLQLPANLFWGSISPEDPPEPVDGFFVAGAQVLDPLGRPFQRLECLAVLGIRRDRAGFSIIPFDAEVGPGIADEWMDAPAREQGRDFESVLPGGEMARLYSVVTTPEALKLIARILWYIEAFPDQVEPETALERRVADRPATPPLTRLPYHRVTLREETR